ncbi:MAG: 7-cyano-7-deazaguanine synthase QueC [Candidatus Latescibacteria bacterium]|nr:7-cyano-7-deazaguanine synthase QueC [Candidatus Latescibacterota bacterium]
MATPCALLLSGGMDSTTCLWWLRHQHPGPIHTLGIDYGQRHRIELECAANLSQQAGAASHQVLELDLSSLVGNPLTDPTYQVPDAAAKRQADTVVPFRNMLFVNLAAAWAYNRDIADIYLAPVRDDFKAYRDCRRPFYDSLEESLQLGAPQDRKIRLHTPFIDHWKSQVVALGLEMAVPYQDTHTCYSGQRPACRVCDACSERLAAFAANQSRDPLAYQ